MSSVEKNRWRLDEDFDSDSNISTKLPKPEDDDKISTSLLHLPTNDRFSSSFSQKRSNLEKERHAELFRKDLISAMKLADSEVLQPEEYFQILDPWKLEWERGVQVPINPGGILPSNVRVIEENEHLYGLPVFKLPKKYLHSGQDDSFKPAVHELHEVQKLTEHVCRYDLDDLDISWLQNLNQLRDDIGDEPVLELDMERVIEEMETRCHTKLQQAQRTIQGLGIEYDENVVCDVCRSPEGEDGNEMVFCDSCDICVHQACYGIQMIPEGNWLCRVCALGIKPQCVLCPNSGGAMKSTKSGSEWAHISCALWIPEVHIGCPDKMEPINNINQIPASRWALVCTLCRERQGACIQCSVKSCKTSFHVTCAFKNNLEMHQIYDETLGDVQMKAFCLKHSGQKSDDSLNDDMPLAISPKTPNKPELTEEEKTELRSHRLKKLEEEFYNYVVPKEVTEAIGVDEEVVNFIYNYWVIKRKSQFNRPLLMPKLEEGDLLLKQREDGLVARLNMFIHLRQELERVRNLCYMVNKREKLSRQMYRMKEDIFFLLARTVAEDSCEDNLEILKSFRLTNTIYDHPDGILRAARLMERMELTTETQESNVASQDKDDKIYEHIEKMDSDQNVVDVKLSIESLVNGGRKEFGDLEEKTVKKEGIGAFEVQMDLSDLEAYSQPISVDAFEIKSESDCISDDWSTPKWITNSFKELDEGNDPKTEKSFTETGLPSSEYFAKHDSDVSETVDKNSDNLLPNGYHVEGRDTNVDTTDGINQKTECILPPRSLLDTGWFDEGNDDSCNIVDITACASFQNEANKLVEDVVQKAASVAENGELDLGDFCRPPSLLEDFSELHENVRETAKLLESKLSALESEKLGSVKLKRARPSDGVRRSKRYRRTNENADQSTVAKNGTTESLSSDSTMLAERGGDDSVQSLVKSTPEISQSIQNESILKHPSTVNSLNNFHSAAFEPVGKTGELNGWSGIRHKFSFGSKLPGSEILKRFSPEQLIVSKEIRQRVERCLLNLPCLKSFNGLCKHLHQKLAACNLHYPNHRSESPKTLDVKEHIKQSNSTSLIITSNSAFKEAIPNGCSAQNDYSTSDHRTKLSRLKDEEWQSKSEKIYDCKRSTYRQQKIIFPNQTVSRELGSDSSQTNCRVDRTYEDPVVYELSDCSKLSAADESDSDEELSKSVGNSSNSLKLNWF